MTSIVIYGSQARGSQDSLSDKDVLICGAPETNLDPERQRFVNAGWSVQTARYDDLLGMARKGYLFYHHLKEEGRIIRDDDCMLKFIFAQIGRPHVDLMRASQDLSFILSLPRGEMKWSDACLSDIYFVFIRNAAINIGYYFGYSAFDFYSLAGMLRDVARLNDSEIRAILQLRKLKNEYRNRQIFDVADFGVIDDAICKIQEKFPRQSCSEIKYNCYQNIRRIELYLTTIYSAKSLDDNAKEHPLYNIWQIVRKPHNYPDIWPATGEFLRCHALR